MLTRYNSSSPLAPRSWPPSPRAVLVVPPLLVLLLAAPLPSLPLRRRRRRRRSPTRIWVSVCSTKRFLTRNLHGYDAPRFFFSEKVRAGCASVLACLGRGRIGCSWTGCRTVIRSAF